MKSEVLSGSYVTIGVIDISSPSSSNRGSAYSHIVTVTRIDTENMSSSAPYQASDTLYIDDHGLYTCSGTQYPWRPMDNPDVPPGSTGTTGCTPFVYGYTFQQWPQPFSHSKNYIIPLPTARYKNYAYSITGIAGYQDEASISGYQNEAPISDYQDEAPFIGASEPYIRLPG
ncbi:hypothetical protein CEUSTIGMA_g10268.t1 [Chlamydomonas eustigma]|uniref:Uncharacterized protein n=1 Tax=Chlamydomonas eustigma TaxID=1157962 RepID=A0A250XIV8_9CHLO|nr:hypothetical protein CEUSTIGMA_g10268.t1 [Chlamydomonas eustigma]|eukprot:GAX82842.1 hypothetical protein CEUSTIGMA_g10268.t1 [Chlamydomonas eustigma]